MIADELRTRVQDGTFGAGRLLPSESELGSEFAASRVTIRRALETLRDDGLVDARQGFGWFVAAAPLQQSLGQLATIEAQLSDSGIKPERRILEFAFEKATVSVNKILDADQVLRVKRLNLADGEPFALVTVWCRADLGQHLSRADVERSPFYELLDVPLKGATQTMAQMRHRPRTPNYLVSPWGRPFCAVPVRRLIPMVEQCFFPSTSFRPIAPNSWLNCLKLNDRLRQLAYA